MGAFAEIIQEVFQNNSVNGEIIASAITFSVLVLASGLSYFVFSKYISKWAVKTKTTVDDEIFRGVKNIVIALIILFGAYYALSSLSFIAEYLGYVSQLFSVLAIVLIAFAATRIGNVLMGWYIGKRKNGQNGMNSHMLFVLKKLMQVIIYIGAFLIIMYVLQINLSGVVVGLGVGGIAIALAVQNTLGDFFSALSIYFDRPFEIGDFVIVGEQSGTVTNIGVKSTRVKLLQGEELIISNKELTSTQVRNFKKLDKRRIVFNISVTYDTPLVKLKKIPELIAKIINAQEFVEFDRAHFSEFGDFSLKFEIVYFVTVSDYLKYMDTQQSINFGIKEAFEKEGIDLAFPTQTVHIS
jgi:small-conductance mechanosensitive channel